MKITDKEILVNLANGYNPAEIGRRYKISRQAIKYRTDKMNHRFKCRSVYQLIARYAMGKLEI